MRTQQIAVIGLGRFGSALAKTLSNLGHEVLGIDTDPDRVAHHEGILTHTLTCDCTEEEALRALGARNFDTVVVAIGHDVQASILITVLLKELGVPRVIVKAAGDLHGRVLAKVGADKVAYPERDMGARLAHSLVTGSSMDFIQISPEFTLVEMEAPDPLISLSLREMNLRARFGVNVLAIKSGDEINAAPYASDVVNQGDILVLLGTNAGMRKLERTLQKHE